MKEEGGRDRFLVAELLRHAEVIAENVAKGRRSFDEDASTRYALENAVATDPARTEIPVGA